MTARSRFLVRAMFVTMGLVIAPLIAGNGEQVFSYIVAVFALVITTCVWPGGVFDDSPSS